MISKIESRYRNRGPHIDNLEKDIPESQAPDLAKVSQIFEICKKETRLSSLNDLTDSLMI